MAYYRRTWEAPMEFEYENTPLSSYNAFMKEKIEPSPTHPPSCIKEPTAPHESTNNGIDFFLPASYLNTPVHSMTDQTMSSQLNGISLLDKEEIMAVPSPPLPPPSAQQDQPRRNDRYINTQTGTVTDENVTTKALVPFHSSTLPYSPSSSSAAALESSPSIYGNERKTDTIQHDIDASSHARGEQQQKHDDHIPTSLLSGADRQPSSYFNDLSAPEQHQQQSYPPHLYPNASFYHYTNPMDHRKSLIYYFAGLIRVGCQLALFTVLLYIGFQFMIALKEDVASKIQVYESEYMEKHFVCEQEYHRNQCEHNIRPAMIEPCRQWLQCLYTPAWIGKTKVIAETFAEIANGFVDTISTKTLVCGLLAMTVTLWLSGKENR